MSGAFLGAVAELRSRVCSQHALAFRFRTPLTVDTRRHRRSDQVIMALTHVLNLVVVADLFDVRSVVELAADADQHYLAVLEVSRVQAVHCTTRRKHSFSSSELQRRGFLQFRILHHFYLVIVFLDVRQVLTCFYSWTRGCTLSLK